MTTFSDFNLADPIARALDSAGYNDPTPIQVQAIPHAMAGRDILGIAQTGTGKTLAFAAPTLHRLCVHQSPAPKKACRVLVLAPTRELAGQIVESFRTYSQFMGMRVVLAVGGVKINAQKRQLERGAHILVATPGRLEDLMEQGSVTLDAVDGLILDEADQMLDLGFIHALRRIAKRLPKDRQTLFFSATMPPSIAELAGTFLTDPITVSVAPQSTTAERVKQTGYFISHQDKPELLAHTLRQNELSRALVFTRTKHGADKLVRYLAKQDIEAVAIHGNKSQPQRLKALEAFKSGKVWVLIATDIAARGIDISGLSHVINYEIPNVPEQYVHRIGRTGRAGAEGIAISFISGDEKSYLRGIEKLTRQKLDIGNLPDGFTQDLSDLPPPKQSQRGRSNRPGKPHRPSKGRRSKPGASRSQGQGGKPGGTQSRRRRAHKAAPN